MIKFSPVPYGTLLVWRFVVLTKEESASDGATAEKKAPAQFLRVCG